MACKKGQFDIVELGKSRFSKYQIECWTCEWNNSKYQIE